MPLLFSYECFVTNKSILKNFSYLFSKNPENFPEIFSPKKIPEKNPNSPEYSRDLGIKSRTFSDLSTVPSQRSFKEAMLAHFSQITVLPGNTYKLNACYVFYRVVCP